MEAHPGALETHPVALEAHSGAMESNPGAVEAHPGAVEAHPGALHAHPAWVHGGSPCGHGGSLWLSLLKFLKFENDQTNLAGCFNRLKIVTFEWTYMYCTSTQLLVCFTCTCIFVTATTGSAPPLYVPPQFKGTVSRDGFGF